VPGWRVHVYLDRMYFGKSYSKIHRKMDEPFLFLGRKHRVLFHDPFSAFVIAKTYYPDDPNALAAANLHILMDETCTRDPGLKLMLEGFAMLDRKKKRRKRKRRKEKPIKDKVLAKALADLRKMEEARRLVALIRSR
jgi:hypothetical protein